MSEFRGTWLCHLIRHGDDPTSGTPTFTYARRAGEVGCYPSKILSSGLMSHIRRVGLVEELHEAGVTIEISKRAIAPPRDIEEGHGLSQRLSLVCSGLGQGMTDGEHVFSSDHLDEGGTIMFHSFRVDDSIPETLWIKARALDDDILAASIGGELEGSNSKRQTALDDFANIGIEKGEDWCQENSKEKPEKSASSLLDFLEAERNMRFSELILPGPPQRRRGCR